MSDTLFEVRQNSLLTLGDGNTPAVPLARMGFPAASTKWDMFALAGRMYNLSQTTIGTALSGGTADDAGIVLTVPWVRFTVPTGYTIFPRHLNLSFATAAGVDSEIAFVYTQTDTFSSSAGVAGNVRNWRSDNPSTTSVTNCYIGASGSVNTEAALVGVRALYQDIVATAFGANQTDQYVVDRWWDDLIPIVGPASVLLFFTGKTTTPSGYFSLDWAEVATVNVKAA